MTKSPTNHIIIAGAGLIGTSIALSLQNTNLSIQLLENHLPDTITQSHTDSRPISLSYGSVKILMNLGVWAELEKYASPILAVHVSEKGKFGFTEFNAATQKVPALGYVVPFSRLQSALYHQAALQKNCKITAIQSIDHIHCDEAGAVIKTNKEKIKANLFIAADGTQSTCRSLLGIEAHEKNTGDTALIYQLALSDHHNNVAYERFTQYGVLAVLPLFEKNTAQLVWSITPRITEKIAHWTDENYLAFLQDVFDGRLSITSAKKSAQFPLKTIIAEKQITQSAVLLGNAAHTIYPVAAQGFNLGLHDVKILSDIMIDAHNNKKNIGDIAMLKKYETLAAEQQQAIFRLTNTLTPLFDFPLIGGLRGLGLLSMDILNPLKNKLAKRTMGMR